MKTLDATAIAHAISSPTSPQKQWIAEHDGEYDDLVYLDEKGRAESKAIGCMLGSYKENL